MRKALPFGAPFVIVTAISSARTQSKSGFPRGSCGSRFPNPSEIKISPKSWRRLSLLDLAGGVLMDANNKRRHHQMATKDGFPPDDRYPVFLSEQAEETVQP